jgi:hypothetical protein
MEKNQEFREIRLFFSLDKQKSYLFHVLAMFPSKILHFEFKVTSLQIND